MLRGSSLLLLICLAAVAAQNTKPPNVTIEPAVLQGSVPSEPSPPSNDEERQKDMLLVSAADIIHGTNHMVWKTGDIRQMSDQCASFEIGFVWRTLEQPYLPSNDEERQKDMLLVSAADIIHGTNHMVLKTGDIRQMSDQCASFEIGSVWRTLEDTFRKMLDLYNATIQIRIKRSNMGHMVYLEKVEKLQWEIYHYHNMLHEIERKYKMDSTINGSGMFEEGKRWTRTTARSTRKTWSYSSKKLTTSWWYPLEYGWNTDYYVWK